MYTNEMSETESTSMDKLPQSTEFRLSGYPSAPGLTCVDLGPNESAEMSPRELAAAQKQLRRTFWFPHACSGVQK
jgi:hypothetical protein